MATHTQIAGARLARAHKFSSSEDIAAARRALAEAHVLDAVERNAIELGADRTAELVGLLTEGGQR